LESGNRFCSACGAPIGEADTSGETVNWQREPGDFAIKIDLVKDDRRQYGGIIVPHGTKAVIVEDGKIVEQLVEGKYIVPAIETAAPGVGGSDGGLRKLFRFWKEKEKNPSLTYPDVSVFFMDAGEVPLEYLIKARTSDPLSVNVDVEARVSLASPLRFIANKLKGNLAYTEGDVKKDLEAVIQRGMEQEIAKFRYDELRSKVDDIAISIQGEANKGVERDGYSIAALSLRIRQEGKDAADEIKSDTAGMQEVGKAALEQGRVQVDLLKEKTKLDNEAEDLGVEHTLGQRKREDRLSDDERERKKKLADADHTDSMEGTARKRELERLAREHKKEDLLDDMGTEREVRKHGRSEDLEDVKHEVTVGDERFAAEQRRKAQELELQQKTREQKRKSQVERLADLMKLKKEREDIRQGTADAEHKRKMDEAINVQLKAKEMEYEAILKGKKIEAETAVEIKKADVDIAKVDADGNRRLAELQEALRKEQKEDSKEALKEMIAALLKSQEIGAGGAERRVKEIKEITQEQRKQNADLAIAKAKSVNTATGKDGPKIQCPHPDCGAELDKGSKFCGKCGKALSA